MNRKNMEEILTTILKPCLVFLKMNLIFYTASRNKLYQKNHFKCHLTFLPFR